MAAVASWARSSLVTFGRSLVVLLCALVVVASLASALPSQTRIRVRAILPAPTLPTQRAVILEAGSSEPIVAVFDAALFVLGQESAVGSTLSPFKFLGASVPGSVIWNTTNTATFTPSVPWPSDLNFTVEVGNIASVPDGFTVVTASLRYLTAPQRMFVQGIVSTKSLDLTGGFWDPALAAIASDSSLVSGLEVPPDGIIELGFKFPIDIDRVGAALLIEVDGSTSPFSYSACESPRNTSLCLAVTPDQSTTRLRADKLYTLRLPAGTVVNEFSGPIAAEVAVSFNGLYPFRFPFQVSTVDEKRLRLYLRHGLGSTTQLLDLESAISFVPPVAFTLERESLAFVIITAEFVPNSTYTLHVANSSTVTDGFGLPLQTQQHTFYVDAAEFAVVGGSTPFPYFQDFSASWVYFTRNVNRDNACVEPHYIEAGNVQIGNLYLAIASFANPKQSFMTTTTNFPIVSSSPNATEVSLETSSLFGSTGAWLEQKWLWCYTGTGRVKASNFITRTNISATIMRLDQRATVWATWMNSASVISGATVTVYYYPQTTAVTPDTVHILTTGKTDSKGLFNFTMTVVGAYKVHVVITQGSQIFISSPFTMRGSPEPTSSVSTLAWVSTDRSFYKPSDSLFVKGYVRSTNSLTGEITVPSNIMSPRLSIRWRQSDLFDAIYPISVSSIYGSFSANVSVPIDASLGDNSIRYMDNAGSYSVAAEFFVTHPRNPTALIDIFSQRSYYPLDGSHNLDISLTTFTRVPISDASLILRWKVKRDVPSYWLADFAYALRFVRPAADLASDEGGAIPLRTDANGHVHYTIDLNALLSTHLRQGDSVHFSVEYVTPALEVVRDTISLPVSFSSFMVGLKPASNGQLPPGAEFQMIAVVQDVLDGHFISNMSVQMTLHEWDGSVLSLDRSTGLVPISTPVLATCTVNSGYMSAGCPMVLPSLGRFLLLASVDVGLGPSVTSAVFVGQVEADWALLPLNSLNQPSVVLDKTSLRVGDTVTLSFWNPYRTSTVLTRFGSMATNATDNAAVTPGVYGASRIATVIGAECAGGCYVTIAIVAPSNALDDLSTIVPTSALFNRAGPSSSVQSLAVPVETTTLPLTVTASVASGGTSLLVTVNEGSAPCSSCEVAVFVVNKIVFEVWPKPLVSPGSRLTERYLAQLPDLWDSRRTLSSSQGYNRSSAKIAERILSDSWSTLEWPTVPIANQRAQVDAPDAAYYADNTRDLTLRATFSPRGPPASTPPGDFAWDSPFDERVVTNFVPTPLFAGAVVTQSGQATIPLTLPGDPAQYEIRVLAANAGTRFGVASIDYEVTANVHLDSDFPASPRAGDLFVASVRASSSSATFVGDVTIDVVTVCELLEVVSSRQKSVRMQGQTVISVPFSFRALAVGTAVLNYTVTSGNTKRSFVFSHQVYGRSATFTAASQAIVDSGASAELVLPSATSFTGDVTVVIGFGNLPAARVLSDLAVENAESDEATALDLLAAMVAGPTLESSGLSDPAFDAAFSGALPRLVSMTEPTLGLQLLPEFESAEHFASARLQAFGVSVLSSLAAFAKSTNDASTIAFLKSTWTRALDTAIVRECQANLLWGRACVNFDLLAYAFYAKGLNASIISAPSDIQQRLSLSTLIQNIDRLSVEGKLQLLIAYYRDGGDATIRNDLVTRTSALAQCSSDECFFNSDASGQPSLPLTSLALQAYSQDIALNKLSIKFQTFLRKLALIATSSFFGEELAEVLNGFRTFDFLSTRIVQPSTVTVSSGSLGLLKLALADNTSLLQLALFSEALTDNRLTFANEGVDSISATVLTTFVPSRLAPSSDLLRISKVIRLWNVSSNAATGQPINNATLGQLVSVSIEITTLDYISTLVVSDLVSGAFIPLDDAFAVSASFVLDSAVLRVFSASDFSKDRVTFYAQGVDAGVYTVSYTALVDHNGDFMVPVTIAYDALHPSVYAATSESRFTSTVPSSSPSSGPCLPWNTRKIKTIDITAPSSVSQPTSPLISTPISTQPTPTKNSPILYGGMTLPVFIAVIVAAIVALVVVIVLIVWGGLRYYNRHLHHAERAASPRLLHPDDQ